MPAPSDDEIDYLLSRGKLGGSQRQRILQAALDASRPRILARWRARLAWSAGGLALAAGAAALVLMALPGAKDAASFREKGSGDRPLLVMACLGGEVNRCPPGAKVAFALEGGHDAGGFLTVYAQPTAPGEKVWYLANEPVGATEADGSRRVIRKAALIGDGQPPGTYRVHAILTRRQVARDAITAVAPAETLAVVELPLTVSR